MKMNVERILATKCSSVVVVRPDDSIREALALLDRHNIGALVVVDETNHPMGILSERDIVRGAARDEAVFDQRVDSLMTEEVIITSPTDDARLVALTMMEKRFRHLPVVDNGELVGIISIMDVVRTQRDQYEGQVESLQTRLSTV